MTQVQLTPLAEQLAQARARRDALIEQVAEASLALAQLRAELARFRAVYFARLGRLLLELEQLETALARGTAQPLPETPNPPSPPDQPPAPSPPGPALKQLYRKVISSLHPDRASDAADAELRNHLVALANKALEAGDSTRLAQLLAEYAVRSPARAEGSFQEQLAQLERQIAHVQQQQQALAAERQALEAEALCRLMQQMPINADEQAHTWRKIAGDLRLRVQLARRLLARWLGTAAPVPRRRKRKPAARPPAQYQVDAQLAVRSPAELLIAQLLVQAGLEYAYEYPVADAVEPLGGFVVWGVRRQVRVWEHAGADWPNRLQYYLSRGLKPGITLFVTHDNPGGGFDLRSLRRVLHHLQAGAAGRITDGEG